MRVLSFDVGMRHLAYLDAEFSNASSNANASVAEIHRLNLIDVTAFQKNDKNKKKKSDQVEAVVAALDAEFFFDCSTCYDLVLVENQPSRKNPTMKSVQVAIVAFFATVRLHTAGASVGEIRLVSARRKLDDGEAPLPGAGSLTPGGAYRARKRLSIERVRSMLSPGGAIAAIPGADRALASLEAAKKKDDLADALLQAVSSLSSPSPPSSLRRPTRQKQARPEISATPSESA